MKKYLILLISLSAFVVLPAAENNRTAEHKSSKEDNRTKEAIKQAMELEKKYAKEQRFEQGSEYDLKSKEFDKETLEKIPVIEPDYDFDMDTGVYDD